MSVVPAPHGSPGSTPHESAPAVPPSAGRTRLRQVAALGTGAALAGAAALVALVDPAAPGSRFPACAFHATTGLWCPGCGLTRGTHHLLNGDVGAAVGSNVLTPVVLAAIVTTWVVWTLGTFGRHVRNPLQLPRWAGAWAIVAIVAFGVVRNLPFAPFDALAP